MPAVVGGVVRPAGRQGVVDLAQLERPDLPGEPGIPGAQVFAPAPVVDSGLLGQFAQGGLGRLLAGLDAALDQLQPGQRMAEGQPLQARPATDQHRAGLVRRAGDPPQRTETLGQAGRLELLVDAEERRFRHPLVVRARLVAFQRHCQRGVQPHGHGGDAVAGGQLQQRLAVQGAGQGGVEEVGALAKRGGLARNPAALAGALQAYDQVQGAARVGRRQGLVEVGEGAFPGRRVAFGGIHAPAWRLQVVVGVEVPLRGSGGRATGHLAHPCNDGCWKGWGGSPPARWRTALRRGFALCSGVMC